MVIEADSSDGRRAATASSDDQRAAHAPNGRRPMRDSRMSAPAHAGQRLSGHVAQRLDLVAVERGGQIADGAGRARAEAEQIAAVHADDRLVLWPAGVSGDGRMREQVVVVGAVVRRRGPSSG